MSESSELIVTAGTLQAGALYRLRIEPQDYRQVISVSIDEDGQHVTVVSTDCQGRMIYSAYGRGTPVHCKVTSED